MRVYLYALHKRFRLDSSTLDTQRLAAQSILFVGRIIDESFIKPGAKYFTSRAKNKNIENKGKAYQAQPST